MPIRHCVFTCDLAEMEKAFKLPITHYLDEFLVERAEGNDRIRELAEMAFAGEDQIDAMRSADRETVIKTRNLMAKGAGPLSDAPRHLGDETAQYVRSRTTAQFKWFVHTLSASGRQWVREFNCSTSREWAEETINLLLKQFAFSPEPEDAAAYRMARETFLRLTGPKVIQEGPNRVGDPESPTKDSFPWRPREDPAVAFRVVPGVNLPVTARLLEKIDFSPDAFDQTGRNVPPRLQDVTRKECARFRGFLRTSYERAAALAFIG